MSSYKSLTKAKLSIFFKLPFNEKQLKHTIDQIENFDLIGETITPQVSNIQVGPVVLNLGNLTIDDDYEYKISYNFEKFLLEINGEISYMDEAFNEICKSFKNNYDFDKTVRFIEFNQNDLIINEKNLFKKLRLKFNFNIPSEISNIAQSELGLRDITIASSISPLDNDWFSIKISTESLSTSGRTIIRIIKRFETNFDIITEFLTNIKKIDEIILNWINQDGS